MKVVVLGGGRVGGAMARDLARTGEFEVAVADASERALASLATEPRIAPTRADLSQPSGVAAAVAGADLVVGAVPGFMGFETVRQVLALGKPLVDISFFDEDAFLLDGLARERGVPAVVDCGVAPGLSNLLAGHAAANCERLHRFACYVGGLPSVRRWPWEYRAVFSPADVIEEYTRPARLVEYGTRVTRPALSDLELLDLPGVGTVEAFLTDGLRTLLFTLDAPFMVEKTLRFPGHAEKMRLLRDAGFFGREPVEVAGTTVRPLDLTARLLFPAWQLGEGEEDVTFLRVEVDAESDGRRRRSTFDLVDRFDRATGTTSMARTTGYTATAVARLVARGLYAKPGVSPPEFIGREPGCLDFVRRELAERGMVIEETVRDLGPAGRGEGGEAAPGC